MKRALKLILYYFAYQLLFTFLVGAPYNLIKNIADTRKGGDLTFAIDGNLTDVTGIVMLLSGVAMSWHLIHFGYVRFNRSSLTALPLRTLLLTLPLTVGAMTFFNLVSEFANLPDLMRGAFMNMSRSLSGLLAIALMAPLVEELLFRGAIQRHLLRSGNRPRTAILLSAALFGIIHINPAQVPFAFCIGLVFGWLCYRTGSLVPGIIGHFLNNSAAALLMATSTREEMNRTTTEVLGLPATLGLLVLSGAVLAGMYFYLNRRLPQPPSANEACPPESMPPAV